MQSPRISATLVAPSSTTSAPRGSCSNRLRELNKNMIHNAHCITLHVLVPPSFQTPSAALFSLALAARYSKSCHVLSKNHSKSWISRGKGPTTPYSQNDNQIFFLFKPRSLANKRNTLHCCTHQHRTVRFHLSQGHGGKRWKHHTSHLPVLKLGENLQNSPKSDSSKKKHKAKTWKKWKTKKTNNTKHPGAGKATCQCWSSKSSGKRKLATRSRSSLTEHLARLKKRFVTSDRLWPLPEKHGEGWAKIFRVLDSIRFCLVFDGGLGFSATCSVISDSANFYGPLIATCRSCEQEENEQKKKNLSWPSVLTLPASGPGTLLCTGCTFGIGTLPQEPHPNLFGFGFFAGHSNKA